MLNIKKAEVARNEAITVSSILFNNFVSLSLFLVLFCLSGHLYAQMPPALDFPQGSEFDPKHSLEPRKSGISPSAISKNVELVGATGGAVFDVFVQDNYAYVCAGVFLVILDISAPSNPTKVGYVLLPDIARGVYVQGSFAYVADDWSGLRIIDVSSPSSPWEVGFYDTPGYAEGVYVQGGLAYIADSSSGLRIIDVSSPSSPVEVGFYDTPDLALGVYVQGGLAYVAGSNGGLIILRYTGSVPVYYGDVSGNGEITAFDASLILRVVVGILKLNDPNYPYLTLDRADVSGNGTVSALDAALVLQYTVGLITEFPCQKPAGAPALDAEVESKSPLTPLYQRGESLKEAIEKLEVVPLDREGQQVLEILKRLIAKPSSPIHTVLLQNFPNPFNPETWIPFELAQDAKVTIRIYNAKGQLIRTFSLGEQKAGFYVSKDKATYWDGRDSAGEKVGSGVYFYTLQVEPMGRQITSEGGVGSFRMTRKMVILK